MYGADSRRRQEEEDVESREIPNSLSKSRNDYVQ